MTATTATIRWTPNDPTAVRTQSDDVRAIPAALRSEWIKLTSLRANKVILALTAATSAVIAGGLAAKTVTAAGVGLALGITGMAAGFAGSAIGGADLGGGSHLFTRALWASLYIVLAALIGLGVGMIVRHTAAAITGLLMWSFVVESLVAPLLPDGVLHLLPFSAGYRLLDAGSQFEPPVVIANQLARPAYAAIFAGYAFISLAVGAALMYRRDSN